MSTPRNADGGKSGQPARGERRARVRHPFRQQTCCYRASPRRKGIRWAAVRELSAGGVGLVLGRPFEPGERCTVELHDRRRGATRLLAAEVVHVQDLGDGSFLMGCRFLTPLADGELRTLLG